MKYSDFLIESKKYANTKEIDLEEFKKIYASLDNKEPFYRGMHNTPSEIMLVDGSKRERKSIDLGNHYTILFDEFNKDYPKRKNAVFFSGSNNVQYFGVTHYVFPMNDTKIACVNRKDMWTVLVKAPLESKKSAVLEMQEISTIFGKNKISDESVSQLISDIKNHINEYISKNEVVEGYTQYIDTHHLDKLIKKDPYELLALLFSYKPEAVESDLKQMFDAENLKMSLYKSSKDLPNDRNNYEYWIDGEALVIDKRIFDTIKKDLE